jgi:hypothetical protein
MHVFVLCQAISELKQTQVKRVQARHACLLLRGAAQGSTRCIYMWKIATHAMHADCHKKSAAGRLAVGQQQHTLYTDSTRAKTWQQPGSAA